MNIIINPGAATADAAQIDAIVSQIQSDMQVLDAAIKRNIPDGIQTSWSESLRNSWDGYYGADIPEAMEAMKLSATNLRLAVEQALAYNKANN